MKRTLNDVAEEIKDKVKGVIPIHSASVDDEDLFRQVVFLNDDEETIEGEENKNIELIKKALEEISLDNLYDEYEEKEFSFKVDDVEYDDDGYYAIYLYPEGIEDPSLLGRLNAKYPGCWVPLNYGLTEKIVCRDFTKLFPDLDSWRGEIYIFPDGIYITLVCPTPKTKVKGKNRHFTDELAKKIEEFVTIIHKFDPSNHHYHLIEADINKKVASLLKPAKFPTGMNVIGHTWVGQFLSNDPHLYEYEETIDNKIIDIEQLSPLTLKAWIDVKSTEIDTVLEQIENIRLFAQNYFLGDSFNRVADAFLKMDAEEFVSSYFTAVHINADDIPQFVKPAVSGNITPEMEDDLEDYLIDNFSDELRNNEILALFEKENRLAAQGLRSPKFDVSLIYSFLLKNYNINIFKEEDAHLLLSTPPELFFHYYYAYNKIVAELVATDCTIYLSESAIYEIPESVSNIKATINIEKNSIIVLPKSLVQDFSSSFSDKLITLYQGGTLVFKPVEDENGNLVSSFTLPASLVTKLKEENRIFKM